MESCYQRQGTPELKVTFLNPSENCLLSTDLTVDLAELV
jgi:hypothetical protein